MATGFLQQQGEILEVEFFRHEESALNNLRQTERGKEQKEVLRDITGIRSDPTLTQLAGSGVSAASMQALSLVPVVEVAWADKKIQPREREAVLRGAKEAGIREGSPAYALLESSLLRPPSPALFAAWAAYVKALGTRLEPSEFAALREETLERARAVASAAGGFLGLKTISESERMVLDRLEAVFEASRPGSATRWG